MTVLFNQGTITATNGSPTITFAGAGLLPMQAQHGDEIVIGGTFSAFIDTVDFTTQTATIKPSFIGTSGSSKAYTIRRATPISVSASEALERTFKLLNDLSVYDSEGIGILYSYNDQVSLTNPGTQKLSINNANFALATRLVVNTVDGKGKDVAGIMDLWTLGTVIVIRSVETASYIALRITAEPVVASGFSNITVQYVDHDGYFLNNETLVLGFTMGIDYPLFENLGIPTTHIPLNYLRRNAANTALEYRTPAQTLSDISAEPVRTTVTQAEAEAGTDTNTRGWNSLRVSQAIDALGFTGHETLKTAAYTLVKADHGKTLVMNSATAVTLSLTAAATLGQFSFAVKNIGAGTLTIDPAGSETIDGLATFTLITNEGAIFEGNGTTFRCIGQSRVDGSDLTGLTKTQVGLANVDNTSDVNKPVSTAQQNALNLKANLASPTLTGTPLAPTAAVSTNTTQIATTAFVKAAIDAIVAAAPGLLDTLDELAAALGDDPNFATTMTTALAAKVNNSAVSTFMFTLLDDADGPTALTTLGAEPVRSTVSQATAEAGTETAIRGWSALRVAQAIRALALHGVDNAKTAAYTIVKADQGQLVTANSATALTFTMTAPATLGTGYMVMVKNLGAGDLTLAGTWDDGEVPVLQKGQSAAIQTNGSTHRILFRGGGGGLTGDEVQVPGNLTLTSANNGKTLIAASNSLQTLTLSAPSALGTKWMAIVKCIGTGDAIISGTFDDATTSLRLEPGQSVLVTSNGSTHRIMFRGVSANGVVPIHEELTGNGTATITLTNTPSTKAGVMLFIGSGSVQRQTSFTLAGNVITMDEVVPVGTKIDVFFNKGGATNLGINTTYRKTLGTGTAGPFTLMQTPVTANAVTISVAGLKMPKDDSAYTISGNQITFSEPIDAATYWDEEHLQPVAIGTPSANTVAPLQLANSTDTEKGALRSAIGVESGFLSNFRNKLINGDFDIWQRGTSFTSTGFGADRWCASFSGQATTVSRQVFALGDTSVPGSPRFYLRAVVSNVAGAGNFSQIFQKIEGVRTLAGKKATLSFWARADAVKNLAFDFVQDFGTGGSPSATITSIGATKVSVGVVFTKVSVAIDIPSLATKVEGTNGNDSLWLRLWFSAGTTYNGNTVSLGNQGGTFDISHVSVVEGDTTQEADPFYPRHIQQEIAMCQRYWETGYISLYLPGLSNQNSGCRNPFKVTKRAVPASNLVVSYKPSGALDPFVFSNSVDSIEVRQLAGSYAVDWVVQFSADAEL